MIILIIDDEENFCITLQELLIAHKYDVDYALDTDTGLEKLEQKKYDVLILDKNVPTEIQSFQLLEIIAKKKEPFQVSSYLKSLHVIIFTAYGTIKTAMQAQHLGIYNYIEKEPNFKDELLKSLFEIEIINKLHLPLEYAERFFKIPVLINYLKVINQPNYSKRDFLLSLIYLSLLHRIKNFSRSSFNLLIKGLEIFNHIPNFGDMDPYYVKLLHDVTISILKMGYKDNCHFFFQAVQYLTEDKSPLLREIPQFARQWYTYYKILIHLNLMTDEVGDTDIAFRCRTLIKQCMKKYNSLFSDYIQKYYPKWINFADDKEQPPVPVLSFNIIDKYVVPLLKQPAYFIIFDGMRYDLWLIIKEIIQIDIPEYRIKEDLYYSILPSSTLYARNSLIAGRNPEEIADYLDVPYLINNSAEEKLLLHHKSLSDIQIKYLKRAAEQRKKLINIIEDKKYNLKVLIFNFVDDLGHVIDKIKADDLKFRMHVQASYKKSLLQDCLRNIADTGANIVITTDHGNIKTTAAISIPRYTVKDQKHSRFAVTHTNIKAKKDYCVIIDNPHEWGLPSYQGHHYILAKEDVRFLGINQPAKTEYAHGGISMEEMLIPVITMQKVL